MMHVHFFHRMRRTLLGLLALAGAVFILMLALAFSPWPWRACAWLAVVEPQYDGPPDFIVVLGGGGIPSPSGLMRSYAGAEAAARFPEASVVLALPYDEPFENSSAFKMRNELILRGVAPDRILLESKGRNTREQAISLLETLDANPKEDRLLVVTSMDHMRRAVLTFRKAGFHQVNARSVSSEAIEVDLRYDVDRLGGRPFLLPDVGQNMVLRYTFWNHLGYELDFLRELVAMAYYWVKGWI